MVCDWCSWCFRFAFGVCVIMKKKHDDILDVGLVKLIAVG